MQTLLTLHTPEAFDIEVYQFFNTMEQQRILVDNIIAHTSDQTRF